MIKELYETDPEYMERFDHFAFHEVVNEKNQQLDNTDRYLAILSVLESKGISLPLEGQAATTMDNRLEKGSQAQADIFGEGMKDFWKGGHINRWLAENCFGDYYTRTGLDLRQRELITFCFLAAQGGCEPQLISHAQGNMNLGNDKAYLIKVISQCLPYIGYPRSLNARTCVNKAAEGKEPH